MLFLQFMLNIILLFDIPILRQIFGFLYLTFVPGLMILQLLNLNKFNYLEMLLLSVGFSIAFLMLCGLILNEVYHLFCLAQPLSSFPMLITLNIFALIFFTVFYFHSNHSINFLIQPEWNWKTVLLSSPLVLSITGAMLVNLNGNNLILLLMIIIISIIVVIALTTKKIPEDFYPYTVLVIALSILFHSSLISKYIVGFGSDAHVEHLVFQRVKDEACWDMNNPYYGPGLGRFNSMLSITILPAIYSNLLNIDSTWVFKILFPLIFSFAPLCLYQIWQEFVHRKYALASAFLFIAQETFYTEMLGLNRQIIAELFFVLLLFVLISKKIDHNKKVIFFTLFSFALITSHYGLAVIFWFFISFIFISLMVLNRSSKNITLGMVTLFFVMMFSWYIYTSNASAFNSIIEYGNYVYNQLGDFLNPASRGQTVLQGLGLESPPTIWNSISRVFAYLTEALILIGFIGLITKKTKPKFDREFYMLILIAMIFLGALVLVPGLAKTMNMTRFYHLLLFFLAPLCILGAEVIAGTMCNSKKIFGTLILITLVLIPYFLFQTSFVYEIVKSQSWSLPLSKNRLGVRLHTSFAFVTEPEVYGAQWLSQYKRENSELFADFHIFSAIVGYGMINEITTLTNVTQPTKNSYLYLGTLNTVYGIVFYHFAWNTTDVLESNFKFSNMIYSNGDCQIYQVANP